MPTAQQIDNWFRHHPPTPEQVGRYTAIREGARAFALLLNDLTPEGPDKSAAFRLLRETVMTANAAIACGEAEAEMASTRPPVPTVALSRDVSDRSSNIAALSWEGVSAAPEALGILNVRYKSSGPSGGSYLYRQVPRSVFEAALVADSIGKFINANVVKNAGYKFERLPDVDVPAAESR